MKKMNFRGNAFSHVKNHKWFLGMIRIPYNKHKGFGYLKNNYNLLKCKKADSRMIGPWLFFILGIIGVAIAAGVFAYFSGTADIKIIEAKTLSDKLIYGISEDGYLREEVIAGDYDILGRGGIETQAMDNKGAFYFNISIYEGDNLKASFLKGNIDFEIQCRLTGKSLAKCYNREFNLIGRSDSKLYKIKILTGSNV